MEKRWGRGMTVFLQEKMPNLTLKVQESDRKDPSNITLLTRRL